jgi:monoterpene epsilon-lactone hydrolase
MSGAQRKAVHALLSIGSGDFTPRPVDQMREGFAQLMARFPIPEVHRTEGALGQRRAVLVEPIGPHRPGILLYLHGGGFVFGSPETAMGLTASLVSRTGLPAWSLDYRLAPEHPFPAAIDDCLAAYRDLLDQGHDPASIAFAGDSAGGGLTVTTTLAARDAGLPLPGAIVAFSPGLDHSRSGASMHTKNGRDVFFTPQSLAHTGAMYLNGREPNDALTAPAVYADLTGFPPILLQVGTDELMLDDSTRLATRARDAEVDVILDVTAGVPHVFQSFIGQLEEADQALDRAALFLTQKLRGRGTVGAAE